ncbi:alpha/beta hydrolase [Humibacter ginsenosidimutans]|nr:alpha/beta hydrolase [Humibacter ginsenosidimutans]
MVPGMLSNADSALGDWGRAAANLYVKQEALDPANAHADVAWIGYNTPGIVGVTSGVDASQGARRLAAELDADHDTRVGDGSPTSVNVVAHSYGTTTAADALTETAHKVASFTMVASAGLDPLKVTDLARLHVATTHVPGQEGRTPAIYTTGASADHLAPFGADVSGRAEPNPGVAAPGAPVIFGAQSFSSDGDVAKGLLPVEGHNPLGSDGAWWEKVTTAAPPPGHGYFDPGTQSLRNIAATSTGRDAFVDGGLTKTADSWGLSADWEF